LLTLPNSHKQAFEKLVSGMYLGEIVRNILLYFIDLSLLFSGYSSSVLNTHYGLDTAVMSAIEAAADITTSSSKVSESGSTEAIRKIIVKEMGVEEKLVEERDVEIVKWAVQAVGTRAAAMSACAIATVVSHTQGETNKESTDVIDVGIDGSYVSTSPPTHIRSTPFPFLHVLLHSRREFVSGFELIVLLLFLCLISVRSV
jgi:hexokinase